ncbi:MAG: hypothetical protein R3B06_09315 [Kofleriaceae bacterium]
MRGAVVLLIVAGAVGLAQASPVFERVVVVGRPDPAAPWSDGPTLARAGAAAELAVVVVARDGGRRIVLADPALAPLRLGGRAVSARQRRPLADAVAAVRWSIVEPHGFRVGLAANGATSRFYANVSTERADFGRWLGYDRIDYFATEVQPWADLGTGGRIPARVTSAEPDAVQLAGLGTTRYQVAVRLRDGRELASPGAEAVDAFGLLPSVHRVSVRQGDDFLGWLSAYLLVPEVFGSAGGGKNHQTERFTGADCADVMVGALRRTGRAVPYTSVAGLPRYTRAVAAATVLDDAGRPASPIAGVRPGDLIRIDYGGALTGHTPRSWDHVAALWEDKSDPTGPAGGGPDGQLDGFDLVIHMGHPRLIIEPLAAQAPATVDVLRWR